MLQNLNKILRKTYVNNCMCTVGLFTLPVHGRTPAPCIHPASILFWLWLPQVVVSKVEGQLYINAGSMLGRIESGLGKVEACTLIPR